ncbi:MAG: hypothetical protein ACKPJ4_18100, partial [Dolichospermum sp.]
FKPDTLFLRTFPTLRLCAKQKPWFVYQQNRCKVFKPTQVGFACVDAVSNRFSNIISDKIAISRKKQG